MDIVSPEQLRAYEIQQDLNVLSEEEDVNDPFVRPKRKPSQKQLEALKKGRETMRLKREAKKKELTPAEVEIQNTEYKVGRKLTYREKRDIERKYEEEKPTTKKMPRGRPKKVQIAPGPEIIERVEAVEDVATPKQQQQIEEMKQMSQEELDEIEFSKFIKMMGKFETMVTKLEEKKRKEQEEAERKERELEEKYYKKFMDRQKAECKPSKPVVTSVKTDYTTPSRPGLELTEEEQKFSSYF